MSLAANAQHLKNTLERVNILIIKPSIRAIITPVRRYCCLIEYVGAYLAAILSVSPSLHARVLHKRDAGSVDVMQPDRPRWHHRKMHTN